MQQIFRETKSRITLRHAAVLDFPAHIHDDLELVYTGQGGGIAYCDGRKYSLQPGAFFLAFPNQVHHYENTGGGSYWVLIMKPSELMCYGQLFLKGAPENAQIPLPPERKEETVYLLKKALEEYQRDGYSEVIAAYLTALMGKLLPYYPLRQDRSSRDNVTRILQYCSGNFREELTVSSVARALELSTSCVAHIFSHRLSMGFCDYINALRLTEAEQLLQNGNYTVTEVASLSGFPTIRTFNRVFLKKHGISPSAYRKKQQVL